MEGFVEITEQYRKKHYPKGYFAMRAERIGGWRGRVFGAAVFLIVIMLSISCLMLISVLDNGFVNDEKTKRDMVLALDSVPIWIGLIWVGVKKIRKGRAEQIRKCAEMSGYPESTVEEFEIQLMKSHAIAFWTHPSREREASILTTDYLMWGLWGSLAKISDITGAYLVSGSYKESPISISERPHMFLAIFPKNKNLLFFEVQQDRAEYLVSLLLEKNPDIDTAGGAVLTKETYAVMEYEAQMRLQLK